MMVNREELIDEVRSVREAHAAQFSNDLKKIFGDIRSQQKNSGKRFESHPPRRPALTST